MSCLDLENPPQKCYLPEQFFKNRHLRIQEYLLFLFQLDQNCQFQSTMGVNTHNLILQALFDSPQTDLCWTSKQCHVVQANVGQKLLKSNMLRALLWCNMEHIILAQWQYMPSGNALGIAPAHLHYILNIIKIFDKNLIIQKITQTQTQPI